MGARWRTWVEAVTEGSVVAVRRLHGGTTSTVHAVDVQRGRIRDRLVLRRYLRPNEGDAPSALVDRERTVLTWLQDRTHLAAPRFVAADSMGSAAGSPAILSTRLPGRPVLAPSEPVGWSVGLARALRATLDSLARSSGDDLRAYSPWIDREAFTCPPPPWAERAVWARVVDVLGAEPPPSRQLQPIHRDANPGNILWSRGQVTGVVDWVHLCVGPAEADVARCHVNVWLLAGPQAATVFRAEASSLGLPADPMWDLRVLAEMSPDLDSVVEANRVGAALTVPLVHRRARELLSESVSRTTA